MDPDAGSWVVLVPVKTLETAKTRLAGAGPRAGLALAFALDTVAAAVRTASVVVVTDDPVVERTARELGADRVGQGPDPGLNSALTHACTVVRGRDPHASVAALAGDLPALRTEELAAALAAAARRPRSFVSDVEGTGTTLLCAPRGAALDPAFGPRSRAAHRASGAVELDLSGIPGLRRDVDDEIGLWDARRLGVGPATRAELDRAAAP